MFKAILTLGFVAVASAYERDLQGNIAIAGGRNITTTCSRTTTETCSAFAGYCCAAMTRNGTAASTNTTIGVCVPADFHTQTFIVSGTSWNFNCQLPATATALAATTPACNTTTPCANTTTQCCAPRTQTLGGAAGSRAAGSICIAKTNSGVQYLANWNVATYGPFTATGDVTATCPSDIIVDAGDTSFAAAIKVTAVMVLALVAGMFF